MKQNLVTHPFCFAAYPVVALLASNIAEAHPSEALRSLLITLAIALGLLLLLALPLKSWHKAGLLTSLYFTAFFGYNHLIRFSHSVLAGSVSVYNLHRFWLSGWAIILIVGSWWVWRVLKRDLQPVTMFLNVTTAVMLILPLYTIIASMLSTPSLDNTSSLMSRGGTAVNPPDIYYIIVDGYTRADILQEIHGYDNSEFINFLQDHDFYIADNSHSNYAQTRLSLASSLNLDYINDIVTELGSDSQNYTPLIDLIQHSKIRTLLTQQGYQTVAMATGFAPTEFKDADRYFASDASVINAFEGTLLGDTLIGVLFRSDLLYEMKRRRILFAFDSLKSVPALASPKFVFVHIVAPHPPFVFGPNGEFVKSGQEYTLNDGITSGLSRELYTTSYSNQVNYLNQLLMQAISQILADSPQPPIIILQGDHGSGAYWNTEDIEASCPHERMSILNAYYVPPAIRDQLYESITPVNSFRLIFNSYFDTDLETLADSSYFPHTNRPYDLVDVSDRLTAVCQE